jgi:hypothetical protein
MKISVEIADSLRMGEVVNRFRVLETSCLGQSRWAVRYRLVFDLDGDLWAFNYERGATENQEPDEPDEYDCYPVIAVQTTSYKRRA